MSFLSLKAYAKVNLLLAVGKKQPNGYHLLASIMHSVSLADELSFTPAAELELIGDLSSLGEENLVIKAAKALQKAGLVNQGAKIFLKKRIPVAAGLGGGSADAAATLIGLNRLWRLNYPVAKLSAIAATIGADVPFCLKGGASFVTGWGQKLQPLPAIKITNLWLIKVNKPLATAKVYQTFDLLGQPSKLKAEKVAELVQTWLLNPATVVNKLPFYLENDLEEAVFELLPEVKMLKEKLLSLGLVKGCLVSGSGPTLMVWFQHPVSKEQLKQLVTDKVEMWPVRTTAQGIKVNNAKTDEVPVLNAG